MQTITMATILALLFLYAACVYARRIFLSVNNPKPCFNETANLICHYPAVMERVNGQRRYRSFTPNWKRGETNIFPGADALYLNRTATQLTVRPNNFFNGSVQYTCFLLLRRGGEDSASIVLQPQETARKPVLRNNQPTFNSMGRFAVLSWNHTDKGPCFSNLTFSYNITWYPVVGGVPQRGEGQSALTEQGAINFTITNLMNGTDYHVELVGFTSSDPVVYSEVVTVDIADVPEVNPPNDQIPAGGVSTATIAGVVVLVLLVAISVVIVFILSVYIRTRYRGIHMPAASASIHKDEEQKDHSKKAARYSVQGDTGEDVMSKTLPSKEAAVTGGDQEKPSTERQSDQLPKKHVEADTRIVNCKSVLDDIHKEHTVPAVKTEAQATGGEYSNLEDSEPVRAMSAVATSQTCDAPVLPDGAEETGADSAKGLLITNHQVGEFLVCTCTEPNIAPMVEDFTANEEFATPQEEVAAPHKMEPLIFQPVEEHHVNHIKGWGYSRFS